MLKVNNLQFSFGNRAIFKGVSFELAGGQLLRIAGPNGSGKSTLLAVVAGLLDGTSGTVVFDGVEDRRKSLAWIPADANALNPNISAFANLEFWQSMRGGRSSANDIEAALSTWGLKGQYTQNHLPVGMFSTGMKRRLTLARLELSDARVWLLDEPLFGLDDAVCRTFREHLCNHIKNSGAAIVITHDERLVEGLAFSTITLGDNL